MSVDYQKIINQIQRDLPTLPTIVNELTTSVQSSDSPISDVEDVMTSDQIDSSKILKVANASFYRNSVSDKNSKQKAGVSGFSKFLDFILTSSIFKWFFRVKKIEEFSPKRFWEHSYGVAAVSEEIANFLGKTWHRNAFTAGLLHDIGKLAKYRLDEVAGANSFLEDCELAHEKSISLSNAELLNENSRHNLLGQLICKNWGLSSYVDDVAMWHHEIDPNKREQVISDEKNELIDVVILANWIVHKFEFGFSGHHSPQPPNSDLLRRLRIVQSDLNPLVLLCKESLKQTTKFIDKQGGGIPLWKSCGGGTEVVKELTKLYLDQANSAKTAGKRSTQHECKEDIKSDWVGMLASVSDGNVSEVKPVKLSNPQEKVLLDALRFTFGKGMRNVNLLDESIQIADLMSADIDANAPTLSKQQMNLLMEEVFKSFDQSKNSSEGNEKPTSEIVENDFESSNLRNDWIGILATIANIGDTKFPIEISDDMEKVFLDVVKNVFGDKHYKEQLLDESFKISSLLDDGRDQEVPKLSDKQMNSLLGEVREVFTRPETQAGPNKLEGEEIKNKSFSPNMSLSFPPPIPPDFKSLGKIPANTKRGEELEKKGSETESLKKIQHLQQVKKIARRYPRIICLINEVIQVLESYQNDYGDLLSYENKIIQSNNYKRFKPLKSGTNVSRDVTSNLNRLPELSNSDKQDRLAKIKDTSLDLFNNVKDIESIDQLDITNYFKESVAVAVVARLLRDRVFHKEFNDLSARNHHELLQTIQSTKIYFLGILHNIGKIGNFVLAKEELNKITTDRFSNKDQNLSYADLGADMIEYVIEMKFAFALELKSYFSNESANSVRWSDVVFRAENILENNFYSESGLKFSFLEGVKKKGLSYVEIKSPVTFMANFQFQFYSSKSSKVYISDVSKHLSNDVRNQAFECLNDLEEDNLHPNFYGIRYNLNLLQTAKKVIRELGYSYDSEEVSRDADELHDHLGKLGFTLAEIKKELSRVSDSMTWIASLYSGTGSSKKKKSGLTRIFKRSEGSDSKGSLGQEKKFDRSAERAYSKIFSSH